MTAGLYLVTLLNVVPISVNAHDARMAQRCIHVTRVNCKVGKARRLESRARNYARTFGSHNVVFRPIALMEGVEAAERIILRALSAWRVRGHSGRLTEWLDGIDALNAERIALQALVEAGTVFSTPSK